MSKEISTQFLRRVHRGGAWRLPTIMSFLEVFILHYIHRMKNVILYHHFKKHDHMKHRTCSTRLSVREIYKILLHNEIMNIISSLWIVREYWWFSIWIIKKGWIWKSFMKIFSFESQCTLELSIYYLDKEFRSLDILSPFTS
jgi:hypothetical protein